jgi:hypothetical protein
VRHVVSANKQPLDGTNGEPRLCKDKEFANPSKYYFLFLNFSSKKKNKQKYFL